MKAGQGGRMTMATNQSPVTTVSLLRRTLLKETLANARRAHCYANTVSSSFEADPEHAFKCLPTISKRDLVLNGMRMLTSSDFPGRVGIPFRDNSFEIVTAFHVLYHVSDISCALREVRRILKPGGRFYCSTNGYRHMNALDHVLKSVKPDWAGDTTAKRFGLENG